MVGQGIGAACLAGFGAAQLHDAAPRGLLAEMVVVGDHAMHFRAREAQAVGDQGHGGGRDESEPVLDVVQDGQQGARQGLAGGDDGRDDGRDSGRVPRTAVVVVVVVVQMLVWHARSCLVHMQISAIYIYGMRLLECRPAPGPLQYEGNRVNKCSLALFE